MSTDLKDRTKKFSLAVINLVESLPRTRTAEVLGRQLLRSGTSVGANYRAACRARSRKDFIAKLGIVEEECDESIFWLELMVDSGLMQQEAIADLFNEADELLRIFVSSSKTAKTRKANSEV